MKRIMLLLFPVAMLLPACGWSPEAELLAARKTFAGTVRAVTVLRKDSAFTKTEGAALVVAARAGLRALDRWEAQIVLEKEQGGIRRIAPRVKLFRDEFRAVLHDLTTFRIAGERYVATSRPPG